MVALAPAASAAGHGRYSPGAPGLGDAYFPWRATAGTTSGTTRST
ncbi:hypothetical protein ACFQHO_44150 [Actinomadura yumaensis]